MRRQGPEVKQIRAFRAAPCGAGATYGGGTTRGVGTLFGPMRGAFTYDRSSNMLKQTMVAAGALAGGLLIAMLNKTLQLAGVGSDSISIVTGAALIFSVVVASVAGFLSGRRRSKATAITAAA